MQTTFSTKQLYILVLALAVFFVGAATALAGPKDCDEDATAVPGHCGKDGVVVGNYKAVFAYDALGGSYFNLGDGREQGNADSIADLDQETLTICDYKVHYRGDFGGDPFLDDGVIQNMINCSGYDDNGTYNYQIVHESDPRYRGNPDWAIWGAWEYHVLTESGSGNLVRPIQHVGS